jgi:hypothetical protein
MAWVAVLEQREAGCPIGKAVGRKALSSKLPRTAEGVASWARRQGADTGAVQQALPQFKSAFEAALEEANQARQKANAKWSRLKERPPRLERVALRPEQTAQAAKLAEWIRLKTLSDHRRAAERAELERYLEANR